MQQQVLSVKHAIAIPILAAILILPLWRQPSPSQTSVETKTN